MEAGRGKQAVRGGVGTRPGGWEGHAEQRGMEFPGGGAVVARRVGASGRPERPSFNFNGCFHEASQAVVFDGAVRPVVDAVLAGFNGTVMAYGQTGAGKTHTMQGSDGDHEARGVTPRALEQLFRETGPQGRQVAISACYIEVYNDTVYDLLSDEAAEACTVAVEEPVGRGVSRIKGVTYRNLHTFEEACKAYTEGNMQRTVSGHKLNRDSSRSHAVLSLLLERQLGEGQRSAAKLNMVDLAGSERLSKTGSSGKHQAEAQHINKSLSFLEQVVVALGDAGRGHIPYRSSKLTHILKDSLGGNCMTLMVANLRGESDHLEESLRTCRFAERMMNVKNKLEDNVQTDSPRMVQLLQREILDLQQELAMYDSMTPERASASYEPYTQPLREHLREEVLEFLTRETDDPDNDYEPLEFKSLRHVKEILLQCKALFKEGQGRGEFGPPHSPARHVQTFTHPGTRTLSHFSVLQDGGSEGEGGDGGSAPGSPGSGLLPSEPPDMEAKLEEYRGGPGRAVAEALLENRALLKQKKQSAKTLGQEINHTTRKINEPGADPAAVRDLKTRYRDLFSDRKLAMSEAEYLEQLVRQCQQELIEGFNRWLQEPRAGNTTG